MAHFSIIANTPEEMRSEIVKHLATIASGYRRDARIANRKKTKIECEQRAISLEASCEFLGRIEIVRAPHTPNSSVSAEIAAIIVPLIFNKTQGEALAIMQAALTDAFELGRKARDAEIAELKRQRDHAVENENRERDEHDELRAGHLAVIARLQGEVAGLRAAIQKALSDYRENLADAEHNPDAPGDFAISTLKRIEVALTSLPAED